MNGAVRPSFKEKVAAYGTCGSCEQCTEPTEKNASTEKHAKRASQTEAKDSLLSLNGNDSRFFLLVAHL